MLVETNNYGSERCTINNSIFTVFNNKKWPRRKRWYWLKRIAQIHNLYGKSGTIFWIGKDEEKVLG